MAVTKLDGKGALHPHSPLDAQLQATLTLVPAHVWYASPNGALTFVNERTADYLGLPGNHPLRFGTNTGADWDSHIAFLHPDDREQTRRIWSDCLRTGCVGEVNFRVRNAEGAYRWFLSRAEPVRAADGTLLYWIGVNLDIEERKQAEFCLRRSEAYLAEAQRLSQTGGFGWKPDTGEIVWSDETYRIFEYDRTVKPTIDLAMQRVYSEDRADFQKVIDGASRGATDFEHTYRLLLPDGEIKHVHAKAHALQDASGNREFVGAVTDITERVRAEAVIRKQEAELRQVVDTIPAIVWSALPDGSNSYVNSRWVEYSGMSPEHAAGSGWEVACHADDLQQHLAKWLASVATGNPHENEVRFRRSDGEYRWHLDRGVPLRDENGNIVKWYGVTTDFNGNYFHCGGAGVNGCATNLAERIHYHFKPLQAEHAMNAHCQSSA